MSSVPDGRAANHPCSVTTLTPPMEAPLPGALSSIRTTGLPARSLSSSSSTVRLASFCLCYDALANELGRPFNDRVEAAATDQQRQRLACVTVDELELKDLAGSPVVRMLDKAPGNGASIGGVKVVTEHGWFAARPSGTEDIYKIYAESFRDAKHLQSILEEAQQVVDQAIA